MSDHFRLQRFVEAQETDYTQALAELRAGRKESHWIWYIFPQIEGLGRSLMSAKFAISGREEAAEYLAHPTLGKRLRECAAAVNGVQGRSIHEIMGSPDDVKFRSSMTLFAETTDDNGVFVEALRKYFGSEKDPLTVERLNLDGKRSQGALNPRPVASP